MKDIKLNVKALSINKAYYWRRTKTKECREYEQKVFDMLPKWSIWDFPIELSAKVWFSSRWSDIDNWLKLFIDILQKKYGFNDNRIYKLIIEKEITKKWEEFIEFNIKDINN